MLPLQQDRVKTLEEALHGRGRAKNVIQGAVTIQDEPKQAEQTPEDVSQFNSSELQSLLEGNISSWMLFLAPPHREFIRRTFGGPARVTGPSGSGKTALLLHRALTEARRTKDSRVLIVCYSVALAQVLSRLLDRLCRDEWEERARIRVMPFGSNSN